MLNQSKILRLCCLGIFKKTNRPSNASTCFNKRLPQIYHQDANNSVIATTDENGTLTGTQGYDAWGNQQTSQTTGQAIPTYGYTGREPDATGLIYYRARYYHPQIGRFTQKDPLGFIDGINRYAYALNSPTNFIDPSGLVSQGSNSTPNPQSQGGYWTKVLNNIQLGLDVVGVAGDAVPGIGNLVAAGADLLNAGISAGRGDKLGASLSLAAIIPYAGIAATTGKVVNRVGDVASGAGNKVTEGIYEFTDTAGKKYCGQSCNIFNRLKQHINAGKLDVNQSVKTTEVLGGKTIREIAEHKRIQEITGGIPARFSNKVSNKADPIGLNRRHLLDD